MSQQTVGVVLVASGVAALLLLVAYGFGSLERRTHQRDDAQRECRRLAAGLFESEARHEGTRQFLDDTYAEKEGA